MAENFVFSIPPDVRDGYIEAAGGWHIDKNNTKFHSFRSEKPDIFPFPDSLKTFLENDAGVKSVVDLKYQEFLNSIPTIQIRAYVPNSVTTEIVNLLGMLFKGFDEKEQQIDGTTPIKTDVLETIFKKSKEIIETLTTAEGIRGISQHLAVAAGNDAPTVPVGGSYDTAVVKIPYLFYYGLVGSTANHIYELPVYNLEGFMTSNGNYGWQGSKRALELLKTAIPQLAAVDMNLMPMFNPVSDDNSKEHISFTVDLINDTAEHAESNFHFLHTLFPNNKWIQYGIIQGSGSLYDVRVLGGNRFFMCTGNFTCTHKGTLRTFNKDLGNFGNQTRIPDAYSVKFEFDSLLPNNFNNYIFGIATDDLSFKDGSIRNKPGKMSAFILALKDALKNTSTSVKGADGANAGANTSEARAKVRKAGNDAVDAEMKKIEEKSVAEIDKEHKKLQAEIDKNTEVINNPQASEEEKAAARKSLEDNTKLLADNENLKMVKTELDKGNIQPLQDRLADVREKAVNTESEKIVNAYKNAMEASINSAHNTINSTFSQSQTSKAISDAAKATLAVEGNLTPDQKFAYEQVAKYTETESRIAAAKEQKAAAQTGAQTLMSTPQPTATPVAEGMAKTPVEFGTNTSPTQVLNGAISTGATQNSPGATASTGTTPGTPQQVLGVTGTPSAGTSTATPAAPTGTVEVKQDVITGWSSGIGSTDDSSTIAKIGSNSNVTSEPANASTVLVDTPSGGPNVAGSSSYQNFRVSTNEQGQRIITAYNKSSMDGSISFEGQYVIDNNMQLSYNDSENTYVSTFTVNGKQVTGYGFSAEEAAWDAQTKAEKIIH